MMSEIRRPIKPPRGSVQKRAEEACRSNAIPYPVFLSWLRDLEFDLQNNPREILRHVAAGGESFEEAKRPARHEGQQFIVFWELDWLREDEECFYLLDVTIVEAAPKIAKDSE